MRIPAEGYLATGEVKVDGEVLDEPYTAEPTRLAYDVQFPVTVGEGQW